MSKPNNTKRDSPPNHERSTPSAQPTSREAPPVNNAAQSPVAAEVPALPAPHHELLRTTTQVLSHFYPATAPPTTNTTNPTFAEEEMEVSAAAAGMAKGHEEGEEAYVADGSTASDNRTAEARTEAVIEECSSPLAIQPAPWRYMELPFLSVTDQMRTQAGGITSDDADEHTPLFTLIVLLTRLAFPVAVTQMLRLSMSFITTIFMGHYLSTIQFAAAATGLAFTNLSALSIGAGFSSALDTLATQEHGRRKHSPEIAAIFLRSVVCTFVTYFPVAVLYFFCDPILAALIHEDLVPDTAYFLRMSIFIAAPMMLVGNLLKFAQSQRVTQLGVVSSVIGVLTLPPLLFLFRNGGLPGIIVALSIDRFITLLVVTVGVIRNPGLRQCWTGRSLIGHIKAVLANGTELWEFTKVGLPILAANCADSGAFEVLGVAAAHLGATSAAVWSIVMLLYNLLFGGYVGLAAAGAIRIGNAMGQGKGLLARNYSYATAALSACLTVVLCVLLWLSGGSLFRFMQSNDEVTQVGKSMTFIVGMCFFFDSIFYAMQGPFRGTGYNGLLLAIILVSLWVVAVPTALVLGLKMGYDVHGLMYGVFAGVLFATPLELWFLWFWLPWEKRALEARGEPEDV